MIEDTRFVTYKIVLIGDPAVGKTSLRRRYLGKGFETNYVMTIGADIGVKRIERAEQKFLLQIWDLSGQHTFGPLRSLYYNNAKIVLIVFDLTNEQSRKNILNWVNEFLKNSTLENIICCVIGNKCDLIKEFSEDIKNDVKEFCDLISDEIDAKVKFFRTSALSGENVNELFNWIIEQLLSEGVL